jgi:hypothetical protein
MCWQGPLILAVIFLWLNRNLGKIVSDFILCPGFPGTFQRTISSCTLPSMCRPTSFDPCAQRSPGTRSFHSLKLLRQHVMQSGKGYVSCMCFLGPSMTLCRRRKIWISSLLVGLINNSQLVLWTSRGEGCVLTEELDYGLD